MSATRYKKSFTLLAMAAAFFVGLAVSHADVIYDDGVYSSGDACRSAVGSNFYDALTPYGQWRYSARLGWVWSPYRSVVGATFRPYLSAGHWVHSTEGWMFVSNHRWGWVPFHYGRWYRDAAYGWTWVPGAQWAPAWVDWRHGDGYVGWAPLGPSSVYLADNWYYVESGYLGRPYVSRYVMPRHRARYLYRRTRRVRRAQRRWSYGPPLAVVTRHRRAHPVRRVRVRAPAAGVVMRVRRDGPSVSVRRAGRVQIRRHHRAPVVRRPRYKRPAPTTRAPRDVRPMPATRGERFRRPAPTTRAPRDVRPMPVTRGERFRRPAPSTRAPRDVRPMPATRGERFRRPAPSTRAPRDVRPMPAAGRDRGKDMRRAAPRYGRSPRTAAPRRPSYERKQPPSLYKKPGPSRYRPPSTKRVNRASKRSNVRGNSVRGRNAGRKVNGAERRRRKGR